MIWAGDFNRHHPMWDNDNDIHLFTNQATRQAAGLIELIANYELNMTLPKGIPTLKHMVTKKYSRPNNFFITNGLTNLIMACEVVPASRPTSTDHFPIITKIQIPYQAALTPISFNFKDVDWTTFKASLHTKLNTNPTPQTLLNTAQIKTALDNLTKAIQTTIEETVIVLKPRPDTKRWWNKKLNVMKKKLNKLRSISFKF